MSADTLLTVYVVSLLAAISFVAIYSEQRRRRFEPQPTEDQIFRCESCGFVYTDDPDVDRSRCSQCGTLNCAIKFSVKATGVERVCPFNPFN
jgi:predicted Zn-ribbon and HTH transcriptional regulator